MISICFVSSLKIILWRPMRFSLVYIFLFFPASVLAYGIALNMDWSGVARRPFYITTLAEMNYICNALAVDDPDLTPADAAAKSDVWGNAYVVVRSEGLVGEGKIPSRRQLPFHVYSLGEDGSTSSSGNDPDDINSWDKDSAAMYARAWRVTLALESGWGSLALFPFTYLGLLVGWAAIGRSRG